ncbi:MAG: hypothetical protein ACPGLV_09830 [Bacteroidia bacterium]
MPKPIIIVGENLIEKTMNLKILFGFLAVFSIGLFQSSSVAQCNPDCGPKWSVVNNLPSAGTITLEYPCLSNPIQNVSIAPNSTTLIGGCMCANTCCCPTGLANYNFTGVSGSFDPDASGGACGTSTFLYPGSTLCGTGVKIIIDCPTRTVTIDCI